MDSSDTKNLVEIADTLKSVAHPERLLVLQILYKGRRTVKNLYDSLGLSQAAVSRHLGILRNSGVVEREQEGKKTYYRLCTEKKKVRDLSKCFS